MRRRVLRCTLGSVAFLPLSVLLFAQTASEDYFFWSTAQAESLGKAMVAKGRVGGTRRVLNTETALSYKLRATWLTPEVIRATARLQQLRDRLTPAQTRALVAEADAISATVVMVELDPDEGSGVIPTDRGVFLQAKGTRVGDARSVQGTEVSELRDVRALAGALRRNYDYDRFWVVFPLETTSGQPLFSAFDREAELVVRIYDKEGRVRWPIPDSIRRLSAAKVSK
jgi:hypothetical protein